jgi:glycine cleavage system H lipoate-binding protein
MKELNELSFPEDLRYAKSHEWVKVAGDTAKIGITDYAQDQLGDRFRNFTYPSAAKLSPLMKPWKTPPS